MTCRVTLDVFRGAETTPKYATQCDVESGTAFDALSRAEQRLNVQLPADQYAVARQVAVLPRKTTPSLAMALAA